jgi:hypothetical protein
MLSTKLKFLIVYLVIDRWGKVFFFQNNLFFVFKNHRKLYTLVCVEIILFLINKLNILAILIIQTFILINFFVIFVFKKILFILFINIIIINLKLNIKTFDLLIWLIFLLWAIIWVHIFHSRKSTDLFNLIFIFLNYINSFLAHNFICKWFLFILSWLT